MKADSQLEVEIRSWQIGIYSHKDFFEITFFIFFETWSHVAQTSLELDI